MKSVPLSKHLLKVLQNAENQKVSRVGALKIMGITKCRKTLDELALAIDQLQIDGHVEKLGGHSICLTGDTKRRLNENEDGGGDMEDDGDPLISTFVWFFRDPSPKKQNKKSKKNKETNVRTIVSMDEGATDKELTELEDDVFQANDTWDKIREIVRPKKNLEITLKFKVSVSSVTASASPAFVIFQRMSKHDRLTDFESEEEEPRIVRMITIDDTKIEDCKHILDSCAYTLAVKVLNSETAKIEKLEKLGFKRKIWKPEKKNVDCKGTKTLCQCSRFPHIPLWMDNEISRKKNYGVDDVVIFSNETNEYEEQQNKSEEFLAFLQSIDEVQHPGGNHAKSYLLKLYTKENNIFFHVDYAEMDCDILFSQYRNYIEEFNQTNLDDLACVHGIFPVPVSEAGKNSYVFFDYKNRGWANSSPGRRFRLDREPYMDMCDSTGTVWSECGILNCKTVSQFYRPDGVIPLSVATSDTLLMGEEEKEERLRMSDFDVQQKHSNVQKELNRIREESEKILIRMSTHHFYEHDALKQYCNGEYKHMNAICTRVMKTAKTEGHQMARTMVENIRKKFTSVCNSTQQTPNQLQMKDDATFQKTLLESVQDLKALTLAENMISGLLRADIRTECDIYLYRGIKQKYWKKEFNMRRSSEERPQLTNKQLFLSAFTSLSAKILDHDDINFVGDECCRMAFKIPKGTPMIHLASISAYPSEDEFVLLPGFESTILKSYPLFLTRPENEVHLEHVTSLRLEVKDFMGHTPRDWNQKQFGEKFADWGMNVLGLYNNANFLPVSPMFTPVSPNASNYEITVATINMANNGPASGRLKEQLGDIEKKGGNLPDVIMIQEAPYNDWIDSDGYLKDDIFYPNYDLHFSPMEETDKYDVISEWDVMAVAVLKYSIWVCNENTIKTFYNKTKRDDPSSRTCETLRHTFMCNFYFKDDPDIKINIANVHLCGGSLDEEMKDITEITQNALGTLKTSELQKIVDPKKGRADIILGDFNSDVHHFLTGNPNPKQKKFLKSRQWSDEQITVWNKSPFIFLKNTEAFDHITPETQTSSHGTTPDTIWYNNKKVEFTDIQGVIDMNAQATEKDERFSDHNGIFAVFQVLDTKKKKK